MKICEISFKNVQFDYSVYSAETRVGCPFCRYGKNSKSKTYRTLKSLLFHIKHDHKSDEKLFPFSLNDIHSILHVIAFAKHLRMIEN